MIRRRFVLALGLAAALLPFAAPRAALAQASDPENTLIMELRDGRVVIAMRPDLAPVHVARIKELVRKGYYDGLVFHRVIRGFMAQTGDPTGTGAGGSGQKLRAEFSREPHRRGTVSMARTSDPNSADSQFFICFDEAPHLNGQYTVWGRVVSGMEFVDNIKKGAPGSGAVTDPDKIVRLRVAADVK
jgi:peptidylprolyl isomerase